MNHFSLKKLIKFALRKTLYDLGLLGLIHRCRNRRTLTTFMFHRVLPRDSAVYRHAEKEFSFSVDGFAASLDFIQRHYHIISLRDLEEAKRSAHPLPDRAALITFDDGWLDTIEYAYPQLKRKNISGVVFISSEILTSPDERWWQDALVNVLTDPLSSRLLAQELGIAPIIGEQAGPKRSHAMATALVERSVAERVELLSHYAQGPGWGQQMMQQTNLTTLDRGVLELAAHGHTHAPLTTISDPEAELQRSYTIILDQGGRASMSFPHGVYDAHLVALAERVGFSTIFTSDSNLSSTRVPGQLPRVFGRIHIPENEWTCDGGKISFPHLATFLFFRPIAGKDD